MNPGESPSPFSAGASAMPSTGAASSFGGGGAGGAQAQAAPVSFTIPGNYGQAPIRLTAGEGRLARPLFRFTGSVGVGYDDNVFQTPTRAPSVPQQVVKEVVSPAVPAHTEQIQVQQNDGTVVTETIEVPPTPATTTNVTIPGVAAQKRQGSLVSRATAGWDVQFATRRTVFTFDLSGGDDYYWDRPGTKSDYNGNLSLAYLHKFSPRLQVSANVAASYQTQPNLGAVNTPTNNNVGPYLNLNSKGDITYRWLPRFSTVSSVSYSTVYYTDSSQQANTFDTTTFGTELRYLYSPRLTLVGEGRYSVISYENDSTRSSDAYFLLGGADISLSRRFFATIRFGAEDRTFTDTDSSKTSPYFELTANYNLTRTTSLSANAHYGFEEPPNATTTVKTFRGGLTLSHAFTPRLSTSLALNLVNQVTTDELTGIKSTQNTAESNLGLYYTLSRKWSFSLNYTYDVLFSGGPSVDYYRNRIFLTANYTF